MYVCEENKNGNENESHPSQILKKNLNDCRFVLAHGIVFIDTLEMDVSQSCLLQIIGGC